MFDRITLATKALADAQLYRDEAIDYTDDDPVKGQLLEAALALVEVVDILTGRVYTSVSSDHSQFAADGRLERDVVR